MSLLHGNNGKLLVYLHQAQFLMRLLFCKIHCPPFICFCKPSPHIYTPGPLKLVDIPHPPLPSKLVSVPETSDQLSDGTNEIKEENLDGIPKPAEPCLKSSLRKRISDSSAPKQELKKRVQWMDFFGKELVEIREFECSELEDTDNEDDNRRGCICVIL